MTTKTLDTTVSQLLQDNSSVEYVAPEKNPIATTPRDDASVQDVEDPRSLELIFGQKHNEIDCALCPTAKRACNRAWFSAKQVENWSEMSKMTLWRWLERIEKARRIASVSDMIQTPILDSCGVPHETTLYNLNVLNQLAMACIDNEKLNDISCKFSDFLSEKMTEGVSDTQSQPQPVTLPNFCNPAEAARAWADLYEKNQATELRAITAESERDEAIRTKTQYQSNLAAQMSGRVGGLTTALNRVRLENDRLKGDRLTKEDVYTIMDTQGVRFTLKTVKDVIRDELNIISEYLKEPFPKIPTGERTDPNGKTFEVKSYVYTRKTVQAFFEYVENNPMGWQARNRKSILNEWLNHHMTRPA